MGGASFRFAGCSWAVLAACLFTGPAWAEDSPSAQSTEESRKLERVREEIDRLQSILEKTRMDTKSVLGELQRLDLELALHRRQIVYLGSELRRCRSEIEQASLNLDESRRRLETSRKELAARMQAMYRRGPLQFERVLLTTGDPAEVVSAYRMAARAALSDQARIGQYRTHESEWRQALGELEARKSALTQLRAQEMARRRELEPLREQRSQMLSGLRKETSDQEGALAEMAETQEALERLVRVLIEGGSVGPDLKVSFERFRGLLQWPVPGKVLVGFGAQRNARFETLVPHPGLDLSVAEGEPIRAVYEGVVAFSDWFKGYGNLIVLEHGDGFMSVYAHASDRLVSTGDRVSGGQVIARAGDTGSLDGPKLYFEIIKDGKPENPVGWLTRR
ncbi:MAG: peptidoglycan DD-metalloendopeptidase family protein [Acidobacteria bacterium]|nr:peptidoglycan DD-metalloendopeptidase family protein [Acidobacteriota bacterium]